MNLSSKLSLVLLGITLIAQEELRLLQATVERLQVYVVTLTPD